MQYTMNRKLTERFIILIISLIIIFIQGSNLVAADNVFNDLEGMFLQDKWIESDDEVIIYFINFHQVDRETANYFSLSAYFSNQFDTETGWAYCQDKNIMELSGVLNRDNIFTIRTYQSLLNSEQNYFSWLAGSLNRQLEFGIQENYYGLDKTEQLEHDLEFEINLIPERIVYENKQILTGIEFVHNSSSGKNRIVTKSWLEGNTLNDIAIAARRKKDNNRELIDYYILQMAAFVMSAEDFAALGRGFLPIGDLSGINKLFKNTQRDERDKSKTITLKLADKGVELEYRGKTEKYFYLLGLKRLHSSNRTNYYADFALYLDNTEDIALSFIKDDDYRLGFSDQLKWTANLSVGISYYPLSLDSSSDNLAYLNVVFKGENWSTMYKAGLKGDKKMQEISLSYIPGQNGSVSLSWGLDYYTESYMSLAYSYSLF